jgi:ribosome maturation factor RimP
MLTEEIRQVIVDTISATQPEAFIVDITLVRGRQSLLGVKVDTDTGISLSECSELSRKIGAALEERPDMDFSYLLEVSSPGVGYPLKLHRQYVKEQGRHLQVATHDGEQLRGLLKAVDEEAIELELILKKTSKRKRKADRAAGIEPPDPIRKVAFEDIKEAKVIIV